MGVGLNCCSQYTGEMQQGIPAIIVSGSSPDTLSQTLPYVCAYIYIYIYTTILKEIEYGLHEDHIKVFSKMLFYLLYDAYIYVGIVRGILGGSCDLVSTYSWAYNPIYSLPNSPCMG